MRRLAAVFALSVAAPLLSGAATAEIGPRTPSTPPGLAAPLAEEGPGRLLAGAAKVDATWHVGASAGQYAGEGPGSVITEPEDGGVDPHLHSTTSNPTYGVESRSWVRALVVEETGGQRWALVTNDLYIPQEVLNQRVAGILEAYDAKVAAGLIDGTPTGISDDNLTVSVSHDHVSPYYSSTTWGPWAFQDTFDIRFFEFMAQKMADAVIEAVNDTDGDGPDTGMVPARLGAATTELTVTKANPEGPSVGANGAPAAFPSSDTDPTFTLVRVDDLSGEQPRLLANWAVFGRHPEGLDGHGFHAGEYVNKTYRIVERELGGITLWSQSDVGTGEITEGAEAHAPSARQEWDSDSINRRERLARRLATTIEALSIAVAAGEPGPVTLRGETVHVDRVLDPDATITVGVQDLRFAPPGYRASPRVSNCRTREAFHGNPGVPVVGLPNCGFPEDFTGQDVPSPPGVTYETLRQAGIPVPDNYGGPSAGSLQETPQVHLQAVRLGSIGITLCPCEQWTELSRNIRSRLDTTPGNLYFGWDWTANYTMPGWQPGVIYDGGSCAEASPKRDCGGAGGPAHHASLRHGPLQLDYDPDTPGKQTWCVPLDADQQRIDDPDEAAFWRCLKPTNYPEPPNPTGPEAYLEPITDTEFRRWKARIYNDARGWDATENSLEAESEPIDPSRVWGNWIHEELDEFGYELVIPVSMVNAYFGYQPTYREFQVRDYYRKALAGLGPHSSDFLVTRLTRMAAELNDAPATLAELSPKDVAYQAEEERTSATADAIGQLAQTALPAYEAQLPADGGTPAITAQPSDITRFQAARFTWVGGSNYTDVPHARVQRCIEACGSQDARWVPFGDGSGEVQTIVDFPDAGAELAAYRAGTYTWHWTAFFEAYDSEVAPPDASGHVHADAEGRGSQVPDGVYRFVVDGCFRHATPTGDVPDDPDGACGSYDPTGRVAPYELVSEPFRVGPWRGLTVESFEVSADGRVATIDVGPDYPYPLNASNTDRTTVTSDAGSLTETSRRYTLGLFDYPAVDAVDYPEGYDSPFPYLQPRDDAACVQDGCGDVERFGPGPADDEVYCFTCTFEPWADTGAVASVTVTVVRNGSGAVEHVAATFDAATRTWSAPVDLRPFDRAYVATGGVVDTFGEINGRPSRTVTHAPPAAR